MFGIPWESVYTPPIYMTYISLYDVWFGDRLSSSRTRCRQILLILGGGAEPLPKRQGASSQLAENRQELQKGKDRYIKQLTLLLIVGY